MPEWMNEKPQLHIVKTEADRAEFEDWLLAAGGHIAVDTETTGLDVWHDRLRVVQFGDAWHGWAIPVEMSDFHRHIVNWAMWLMRTSGRDPLIAHRMKFDIQFLRNAGFDTSAVREDSKAGAWLLNPAMSSLKPAAAQRFGEWVLEGEKKMKDLMKKNKWTWSTIPIDTFEYLYYAGMDPILTARLYEINKPLVDQHYRELYELELEVALVMVEAEQRGMNVDLPYCQEQLETLMEEIIDIEERWEQAEVNLGSVRQCAEIIEADGTKLPRTAPSKTFPKGQAQVTEEVLEDLIRKHPDDRFAIDLLQWRRLNRNATTYFGSYIDLAIDGKIHTFIETLGARNGRMSSRNPNLQNVPKRRAGDYVRRAFYAAEGHTLISADYAQIEYRIFAAAAREPAMIEAILNGEDLHAVTARIAYDDPSIDEEDPRRDIAKNANFAEIYMAGIEKFAKTAGISVQAATDFKKVYHKKFTSVKPFTKEVMKYAQANGLAVDSKFGRRIPVDADRVYAAVNYLISSTAADELKRGIQRINATDWIQYFLLPIHDELIFEVPDELVPQALVEIPALMADCDTFSVPIEADVKAMKRWGEKPQKEAA